jgi:hypothetical protein
MAWYDDILGSGSNIFGARAPDYLMGNNGLLDQAAQQKLTQRALTSGLLGTALTYLAMPKNQNYKSALPYLGKAFLGGMQQSQGVYDQATQDYVNAAKLKDIQTTTTNKATIDKAIADLNAQKAAGTLPKNFDMANWYQTNIAPYADKPEDAYKPKFQLVHTGGQIQRVDINNPPATLQVTPTPVQADKMANAGLGPNEKRINEFRKKNSYIQGDAVWNQEYPDFSGFTIRN